MVSEWDKTKVAKFRIERFCPDCGRLLVSTPDEELAYKTEPNRHSYFMHCPWCQKPLNRIDLFEPYLFTLKKNESELDGKLDGYA